MYYSGLKLRKYQVRVARAVVDPVVHKRGLTFVVIFPRQSGKNELQAQIEMYLLAVYHNADAEIVKISPTWKPQTLNAMRRLRRGLRAEHGDTGIGPIGKKSLAISTGLARRTFSSCPASLPRTLLAPPLRH